MSVDGFGEIIATVELAKELRDAGRNDVVEKGFYNKLSCDAWFENMYGAITSVFSGFYNVYDELNETERMIFTDDLITEYFCLAYEHGRKYKVPHSKNPFVMEALSEANRWLNFCYTMDWNLLGYTRTQRAAKKSKLIVYLSTTEFCEHEYLAYGLLMLYKWFSAKCEEYRCGREAAAA